MLLKSLAIVRILSYLPVNSQEFACDLGVEMGAY